MDSSVKSEGTETAQKLFAETESFHTGGEEIFLQKEIRIFWQRMQFCLKKVFFEKQQESKLKGYATEFN